MKITTDLLEALGFEHKQLSYANVPEKEDIWFQYNFELVETLRKDGFIVRQSAGSGCRGEPTHIVTDISELVKIIHDSAYKKGYSDRKEETRRFLLGNDHIYSM